MDLIDALELIADLADEYMRRTDFGDMEAEALHTVREYIETIKKEK